MIRTFSVAAALSLVALPAAAQLFAAPTAAATAEQVSDERLGAREAPPASMVRGSEAPLSELMANPRTRAVLERELPELIAFLTSADQRSLSYLAARAPDVLTQERLETVGSTIANTPLAELRANPQAREAAEREFEDVTNNAQFSVSLKFLAGRMPDVLPPERLQALDAELSALRSVSRDAQAPASDN